MSGAGVYESGDTVTLGAQPNQSWTFSGWQVVSGDVTIEDNQFTVQHEDVAVKAIFEPRTIPYVDAQGTAQTPVTGFSDISADTATLSNGWYVVEQDVVVNDRITVTGDVNLILCNSSTLTAHKGIGVNHNTNLDNNPNEVENSLTIWQQAEETNVAPGTLVVDAPAAGFAGIGGNVDQSSGSITVNGGTVTATGGNFGAGIGVNFLLQSEPLMIRTPTGSSFFVRFYAAFRALLLTILFGRENQNRLKSKPKRQK